MAPKNKKIIDSATTTFRNRGDKSGLSQSNKYTLNQNTLIQAGIGIKVYEQTNVTAKRNFKPQINIESDVDRTPNKEYWHDDPSMRVTKQGREFESTINKRYSRREYL